MISFRFHIVSLTAVLLALGIGLVLGTTFLDDATVNTLRNQLSDLEGDLDAAGERNHRQQDQIESFERESAGLDEQMGERLFRGQLSGAPVLVIATRGVDEARVDGLTRGLRQASADLVGTWWLSDRLALDDDSEVSDLGDALQLSTDDTDRLRSNLAGQLGDVLFAASDPGPEPDSLQGLVGAPAETADGEPAVVARLREGGFIDYQLPEGAEGDVIVLPESGLRVVVVGGPGAEVAPNEIVVPILIDLAADGPMPAVATEPSIVESENGQDEPVPSLVVEIREDDDLSQRVSTVDDLDRVSGLMATVLALVDAEPGSPRIGHYGLGDGTRLLPPAPEEDGE
jgi:Copper transport outer membrane protein, MctB